ncbi:hypothetical protein TruAng_010656 [Truncatella angustata]|nr:hypothetical protein TruAng_010656 [Truncatella angustata]
MSWAANRVTTRPEDMAYCLLGIFDIHMPLIYGEGSRAFQRLQEEIMQSSDDQTILAWGLYRDVPRLWGVSTALAQSPSDFSKCGALVSNRAANPGDSFGMTQRGLQLNLPIVAEISDGDVLYCVLNCTTGNTDIKDGVLALPLLRRRTGANGAAPKMDEYYRLSLNKPVWLDPGTLQSSKKSTLYLRRLFRHTEPSRARIHFRVSFHKEPDYLDSIPEYVVAGIFPPEISNNDLIDVGLYPDTDSGDFMFMVYLSRPIIKCLMNFSKVHCFVH